MVLSGKLASVELLLPWLNRGKGRLLSVSFLYCRWSLHLANPAPVSRRASDPTCCAQ